jgi:hypothetical protein
MLKGEIIMGNDAPTFVELVKYERVKDGKTYLNIGVRLTGGYVIPISVIVGKHYYQLKDIATLITLNYTKTKKEGE